jgi:outer membrane protein TolC
LRKQAEAQALSNKTMLYPSNPRVEFNYLWGNANLSGNRTDLKVTQSFDFPSAYAYRNQIADSRNIQVDLEYKRQKMELLLQARLLIADIIYSNAYMLQLDSRLVQARNIEAAYKAKLAAGEVSILDLNKARLNVLNLQNELDLISISHASLLADLKRLNGGIEIDVSETMIINPVIPADFESWYAQAEKNSPVLGWLKQEVDISHQKEKLAFSTSLPGFFAGYMSENYNGEKFQGITSGITIPLWEGHNTVKYAKLQTIAFQDIATDAGKQFYERLKIQFNKAVSLQKIVTEYKSALNSVNNADLLMKAFDKGEITFIEYMLELTFYYESVNTLLETERDLNKTIAAMNQYGL